MLIVSKGPLSVPLGSHSTICMSSVSARVAAIQVQLVCDGERIQLQGIEGIIVLNVPSYGGGANLWGGEHALSLAAQGWFWSWKEGRKEGRKEGGGL